MTAGSRLRLGARIRGARAYVAVSGGIDVPPMLGSRATHVVSRMGGLDGRALRTGDRLPLGRSAPCSARFSRHCGKSAAGGHPAIVPLPDGHARIRVLAGPQTEHFSADALDVLQSAPYTIGQQSDRMGFRLEGPPLTHARGADIISDATPLGVLQVPASGQPILLMADRQPTGGYPKLATVIAADLALAGQLAPADRITFVACSPQEAMAALIAQERALMALEGLHVVTDFGGRDARRIWRSRPRRRAARADDHLPRRRSGGVAARDAKRRRDRRRAPHRARGRRRRHDAGRRIERADRGRRHPRPGDPDRAAATCRRSTTIAYRADAAVTINGLVRWTINHACAGLEAWAGTPGTVGGAIFGNAHFGGRLIGDLVDSVRLACLGVDGAGRHRRFAAAEDGVSNT